ncbi:uncharacterized protein BDZ83DRAFT_48766 [Colletotrichum acutatum]|uniref:Uncharacterized protein n=1 Tax=Glomerella acutata TaxID=27357 RepID=A0AAD8XKV3_GLOAC|nr:uncharacterized protein BDZ83DRAFT_48766 [Colletotrichum acutatum]KAK1729257.1 hypothetical protein BDZ83DRAFT_48766 [Colletotrichum acutatum]
MRIAKQKREQQTHKARENRLRFVRHKARVRSAVRAFRCNGTRRLRKGTGRTPCFRFLGVGSNRRSGCNPELGQRSTGPRPLDFLRVWNLQERKKKPRRVCISGHAYTAIDTIRTQYHSMRKDTQRSCGPTRFRYRLNLYYWIPYGYVGGTDPVTPTLSPQEGEAFQFSHTITGVLLRIRSGKVRSFSAKEMEPGKMSDDDARGANKIKRK